MLKRRIVSYDKGKTWYVQIKGWILWRYEGQEYFNQDTYIVNPHKFNSANEAVDYILKVEQEAIDWQKEYERSLK